MMGAELALASGVLELAAPTVVRLDPAISGFGVSVGIGVPEVVAAVAVVSGMGDLRFWPAAACIGACGWVCGVAEVDAPTFCSMRQGSGLKRRAGVKEGQLFEF